MLHRLVRPGRALLLVLALALVASACGGSDDGFDESPDVTTDDLFAPGEDALDLTAKPPIDESYLVPVDELVITDLVVGDGDEAVSRSVVSMQYVGVLAADGSQFDASWDRGADPLVFNLDIGQVIPGWDEGIQGMKVGGRRVLQIPAAQAYGTQSPSADIPADSDLVFIVDLVDVQPPPPPTPTPQPAPPIPEDALGSFDELGIIDLVEGEGPAIERGDIVSVNYVGVSADTGVEFDSSWSRSAEFALTAGIGSVIEGWRDGLIGAQVGTERILQIPSDQAYGEGDLVFRVHIEDIREAPLAHTVEFFGVAPMEVETESLIDGDGDGAEEGDVVNARIAVRRWSDGLLIQSTYENDTVTPLFVSQEGLLPGLNDAVIGIQAGETRQIVVPAEVAFPDGVPGNAGVGLGDALVFIIEVVEITTLDDE